MSSARAIILKKDRVLVMHNLDGTHILPGGRFEKDETFEETLQRELLEEAGVRIKVMAQIGVVHFRLITLTARHLNRGCFGPSGPPYDEFY